MELKKCKNCGAFIASNSNLCTTCSNTLSYSKTILKGYFDEGISCDSIKTVSSATGVSPSIVQNYMIENNYIDVPTNATDDYYTNLPY